MTQTNGPTGRVLPDLSKAFGGPAPVQSPTSKGKPELSWETLEVNTLSKDLQELYISYRAAEDIARKARKAFEFAMTTKLDMPPHLILRFGYKYGKLAVAIDADARSPKAKASSLTLEGLAHMVNKR